MSSEPQATIRSRVARSRQAQKGSKRVEIVLDAGQLSDLDAIKTTYGYNTAEAIGYAISASVSGWMRDRKA